MALYTIIQNIANTVRLFVAWLAWAYGFSCGLTGSD